MFQLKERNRDLSVCLSHFCVYFWTYNSRIVFCLHFYFWKKKKQKCVYNFQREVFIFCNYVYVTPPCNFIFTIYKAPPHVYTYTCTVCLYCMWEYYMDRFYVNIKWQRNFLSHLKGVYHNITGINIWKSSAKIVYHCGKLVIVNKIIIGSNKSSTFRSSYFFSERLILRIVGPLNFDSLQFLVKVYFSAS